VKLKYAGPKPIISHTGIEFDKNKEDKYVYLNIVVELLKALSHEYVENRTYIYKAETCVPSDDELYNELKKYCPNICSLMDKESHNIEDEIEHQIQRAHENRILSNDDKEVLEKNIEIMHDYLIQRSVNKSVYYCGINALAELLKKDHIDYIVAPMTEPFLHVFHSLQGSLEHQKVPMNSAIDIYKEDGVTLVKLQVITTN
jgi:hypothetical protein